MAERELHIPERALLRRATLLVGPDPVCSEHQRPDPVCLRCSVEILARAFTGTSKPEEARDEPQEPEEG